MQINLEAFIERMVEKFNNGESPNDKQESNEIEWSSDFSEDTP